MRGCNRGNDHDDQRAAEDDDVETLNLQMTLMLFVGSSAMVADTTTRPHAMPNCASCVNEDAGSPALRITESACQPRPTVVAQRRKYRTGKASLFPH